MLDQHWEGIQKKDAQLVEEMRGQLEKSRKSSSEFFLQFEASTTKMKELWQKQHALNVELAAVTQEIASKEEEIINSLYVQEIDDQIDEKINQVLGGDSLNADLILKPSFKKCLHNALNDPLCLKEGGGLIGILKQHLYQEFGRCIDSLGIVDKSLSNAQDKITKLAHIRDNFISKLADPSSTHFHKLCDEMLVFSGLVKKQKEIQSRIEKLQQEVVVVGEKSKLDLVVDWLQPASKPLLDQEDCEEKKTVPTPCSTKLDFNS